MEDEEGERRGAKVVIVGPEEVPGVGRSFDWASTTSTASFRLLSVEANIAAGTLLSKWGKRLVSCFKESCLPDR